MISSTHLITLKQWPSFWVINGPVGTPGGCLLELQQSVKYRVYFSVTKDMMVIIHHLTTSKTNQSSHLCKRRLL